MVVLVLMSCITGRRRAGSLVLLLQPRSVSDEQVLGKEQRVVCEGKAVG